MGASVTGSGRQITTHMIDTIEFFLTGIRKEFKKVEGKPKKSGNGDTFDAWHYITSRKQLETLRKDKKLNNKNYQLPEDFQDYDVIIYGDTDSCYFLTKATNKEEAVAIADEISESVNNTFPSFVTKAFKCQPGYENFIKCGREVVQRGG